jgi:glycosyltransferase involved in cell wall biosynthesis
MYEPLISCMCLTANRPQFLPTAIACFMAQTWSNKELLILDNGSEVAAIPKLPGVRVIFAPPGKLSIGALRNRAAENCHGRFIATWDDDDFSMPGRLEEQFNLLSREDAEIVGYRTMYFRDDESSSVSPSYYKYRGDNDDAIGTSFFYRKTTWEKRQFREISDAEDFYFAMDRNLITARGDDPVKMIARRHAGSHPYPGMFEGQDWKRVPFPVCESLDKLLFSSLTPLVSR